MSRQPQAEKRYLDEFAAFVRNAGWGVASYPEAPPDIDFLIYKDWRKYVVELKRSPESRRDRIVPLLSEAILQVQASSRRLQKGEPLAVIASRNISPHIVEQVLSFWQKYAANVSIGLFDEQGFRLFRGPGLEDLSSSPPDVSLRPQSIKPKSYPLFSDLGQWMLKVVLAQYIDPKFLRGPRKPLRNASELASAAGVSPMSASRLLRQLLAEGFLDSRSDRLRLVRFEDLLDEWQSAVRRSYKEIPCRWIIPGHGVKQFHSELRVYWANISADAQHGNRGNGGRSPRVCLGLFSAAEALGMGFVHGVPPILYVEYLDSALLNRLGISSDRPERSDVNVRIPAFKESIFRGAVDVNGLPISDAVQIWLDVSSHPSRGKEQAVHLRQRVFGSLIAE